MVRVPGLHLSLTGVEATNAPNQEGAVDSHTLEDWFRILHHAHVKRGAIRELDPPRQRPLPNSPVVPLKDEEVAKVLRTTGHLRLGCVLQPVKRRYGFGRFQSMRLVGEGSPIRNP